MSDKVTQFDYENPTIKVHFHKESRFSKWQWKVSFPNGDYVHGKCWKHQTAIDRVEAVVRALGENK